MIDIIDYKKMTLFMNNPLIHPISVTPRPRVLVTNRLHLKVLEKLQVACEVIVNDIETPWSHERLLAELEQHRPDGLVAFMSDNINQEVLQASANLRIVAAALKGTNNIDVSAASARGVCVTFVPGLLTEPTAELTLALMLMQARQLPQATKFVRDGRFKGWEPRFFAKTLFGAQVGMLGFGAIGQKLAALLSPFDVRIKFFDPLVTRSPYPHAMPSTAEAVIGWSDYLVLALPYSASTHHLVDKKLISQMPQGSVLVNTARGSIVKESDVAEMLEVNHLSGYVADVFEMEDWALAGRPTEIEPRLLADNRVLMSPHIGSAIRDVRERIEGEAVTSILDFFNARPLANCLNPEVRDLSKC